MLDRVYIDLLFGIKIVTILNLLICNVVIKMFFFILFDLSSHMDVINKQVVKQVFRDISSVSDELTKQLL